MANPDPFDHLIVLAGELERDRFLDEEAKKKVREHYEALGWTHRFTTERTAYFRKLKETGK